MVQDEGLRGSYELVHIVWSMIVAEALDVKEKRWGEQVVSQEDFRVSRNCRDRRLAGREMTCCTELLRLGEVDEGVSTVTVNSAGKSAEQRVGR